MKKLYLLLFLFCASVHVMAQDAANILGSWTGKLDLGQMSLTVVLNFEQANGDVVCTLDSPDQGAKGIAASKEFLSNDSVSIRIESIGATYRASVSGSNLEGVFTQQGYSFPLNMTKGKRVVNRPQHPQPPYPYTTE
ncbi:MAG: alpha/beta hydrolase, partial [Prevotella sp.]|nr:alpha/beta hydrolase [Prevotella sp.]